MKHKYFFSILIVVLFVQCARKEKPVSDSGQSGIPEVENTFDSLLWLGITNFIDNKKTSAPIVNVYLLEKDDTCFLIIYDSPLYHKENLLGYCFYKKTPVVVNSNIHTGLEKILKQHITSGFPSGYYSIEDDHPPLENFENTHEVFIITDENRLVKTESFQRGELNRIMFNIPLKPEY